MKSRALAKNAISTEIPCTKTINAFGLWNGSNYKHKHIQQNNRFYKKNNKGKSKSTTIFENWSISYIYHNFFLK